MKFVVELDDFWLEDQEINEALKSHIVFDVVSKIKESIKEQVETLMNKILKEEIETQLQQRISILMENFMKEGKVKHHYSNDSFTVDEWISKNFKNQEETIQKFIKSAAENQAIELKQRYDLLFASQIVSKINEQGMLKEDVAKLLLNGK